VSLGAGTDATSRGGTSKRQRAAKSQVCLAPPVILGFEASVTFNDYLLRRSVGHLHRLHVEVQSLLSDEVMEWKESKDQHP